MSIHRKFNLELFFINVLVLVNSVIVIKFTLALYDAVPYRYLTDVPIPRPFRREQKIILEGAVRFRYGTSKFYEQKVFLSPS